MTTMLPEHAKELLDARNVVVLTTLNRDGSPHSTPVWAMLDGDDILMSTLTRRLKARNLERDPRASVVVIDPDEPLCYFSINGRAELSLDPDAAVLNDLSVKYLGASYPDENPENVRVTIRLRPERVIAQYEAAR